MSVNTVQYVGSLWNIEYIYTPEKRGGPGSLYKPETINITKICAEGSSDNVLESFSPEMLEGLDDEISCIEACKRAFHEEGVRDAYEEIDAWDRKERR